MSWIYLDGKFVPAEEAAVSVYDHGLLYGDGVFEGIRAYNGRVFRLEEHVKRLYDSAKAIMLEIPMTEAEMAAAILETLRKNALRMPTSDPSSRGASATWGSTPGSAQSRR
jgi:branched-chain amino acid aminotransferase